MEKRQLSLGLAGLALLTAAMFFDALFAGGPKVVGAGNGDVLMQFLPWREFGFHELAKGHLALWNPHIYGGAPYFGGMQSALLYPPNWLYLALPLPLAVNWGVALNDWLLGAFMLMWALRRGLHPFAAFVSGVLAMYCAPYFLHVAAGHLANLSAMPWIPLIFLAIDEWLLSERLRWCLLGMFAIAMQVFAGHPEYVYFTAIIATVYALVRLAGKDCNRVAAAAGLLAMGAGGALLSAVQLAAGMQAAAETLRGQALPYRLASMLGFPPENLVTLLAPGFFGDMAHQPYWGRWIFWEANAFMGVLGFALAIYGAMRRDITGKAALLLAVAASLLLALGDNTPLYRLLYEWLPLFDRFRGTAKFMALAVLPLTLLAGYGLDRMLRERTVRLTAIAGGAAVAAALCAGAFLVRSSDWSGVMAAMEATGQSYIDPVRNANPGFIALGQAFASLGLLFAGLTLAVGVCAAFWVRREPRAAIVLGALAVAEVFAFARMQRPMSDSVQAVPAQVASVLAADPGDYRILNFPQPDSAMSLHAYDVWGYDPNVTRRYAELVEWLGGGDPAAATQYGNFHRLHALLSMLRLKYLIAREGGELRILQGEKAPLPHLQLVGSYRVARQRDEILHAMGETGFDPRREVILEQDPRPAPVATSSPGSARVLRQGTDFLEVEADLAAPSVLLVTDAWASGWRARALPGSVQQHYEIMPADYALQGIALQSGHHVLRLEYAPAAFRIGAIVSLAAWLAWIVALSLVVRRARPFAHA